MEEISKIKLAEILAAYAHKGQKDKGGRDYIFHPIEVAAGLETEDEKITGLLHDVLEDTFVKEETLRNLFGDRICDAVVTLTRKENEGYEEYICRVKNNPLAVKVKLQDLKHNMDLSRLKCIDEKDLQRLEKYRKAEKYLKEGGKEQ